MAASNSATCGPSCNGREVFSLRFRTEVRGVATRVDAACARWVPSALPGISPTRGAHWRMSARAP
eukprot:2928565-Alexandrium_andersonii.AAC.1